MPAWSDVQAVIKGRVGIPPSYVMCLYLSPSHSKQFSEAALGRVGKRSLLLEILTKEHDETGVRRDSKGEGSQVALLSRASRLMAQGVCS